MFFLNHINPYESVLRSLYIRKTYVYRYSFNYRYLTKQKNIKRLYNDVYNGILTSMGTFNNNDVIV